MALPSGQETRVFQGWLTKRGGSRGIGFKTYRRRYFVWTTHGISYYSTEQAYIKQQSELGFLDAHGLTIRRIVPQPGMYLSSFVVLFC